MKRILVPTDFSDKSWNSLVYAMELFRGVPVEFTILNTYDVHSTQLATTLSSERIGHIYDSLKIASEETLKMVMEDISNTNPDGKHIFKTISKSGPLTKILKKITANVPFDFIVMGTKGEAGAKDIFLGSYAQKVLRKSQEVPILYIPEDAYYEGISNIAFATDFSRIYFPSEVKPILSLAKMNEARIRMIHVYDEPKLNAIQEYNSKSLENYFKGVQNDFHVIPEYTNVSNGIQAFVEELEIDFLAMINYEHSFIERLSREPVIKKIMFNSQIPFLVSPGDSQ